MTAPTPIAALDKNSPTKAMKNTGSDNPVPIKIEPVIASDISYFEQKVRNAGTA